MYVKSIKYILILVMLCLSEMYCVLKAWICKRHFCP